MAYRQRANAQNITNIKSSEQWLSLSTSSSWLICSFNNCFTCPLMKQKTNNFTRGPTYMYRARPLPLDWFMWSNLAQSTQVSLRWCFQKSCISGGAHWIHCGHVVRTSYALLTHMWTQFINSIHCSFEFQQRNFLVVYCNQSPCTSSELPFAKDPWWIPWYLLDTVQWNITCNLCKIYQQGTLKTILRQTSWPFTNMSWIQVYYERTPASSQNGTSICIFWISSLALWPLLHATRYAWES